MLLLFCNLLLTALLVDGNCSSEVLQNDTSSRSRIVLNETQYCFANQCTILITESNVSLHIINKVGDWITATITSTNTSVSFIIPANGPNCSLKEDCESFNKDTNYFFAVILIGFFAIISSSVNIVLHIAIKEMRTTPGILIIEICVTAIVTAVTNSLLVTFQEKYRVNDNVAICAVVKYGLTYCVLLYTVIKANYLFHFGYVMYRTYRYRSLASRIDKKLLYLYGAVVGVTSVVLMVIIIVADLTNDRTVLASSNGYCISSFHNLGESYYIVSLSAYLLVIAVQVIFFTCALVFYCLAAEQCCTMGGMAKSSDVRVSITLLASVGSAALLLVVLLFAGVSSESSIIVGIVAGFVEQTALLILFLSSMKVRKKLCKSRELSSKQSNQVTQTSVI